MTYAPVAGGKSSWFAHSNQEFFLVFIGKHSLVCFGLRIPIVLHTVHFQASRKFYSILWSTLALHTFFCEMHETRHANTTRPSKAGKGASKAKLLAS